MQDKVFYASCLGFVLGVLLSSLVSINMYLVFMSALIALSLFLFFKLISPNKWGVVFCVFLVAISFGSIRFEIVPKNATQIFEVNIGQSQELEVLVIDEPDIRESNQKLTGVISIEGESTKILITTDFTDHYKYGDK